MVRGAEVQSAGRWRRRAGIGTAVATMLSAGAGVAHAWTATAAPCTARAQSPVLAAWGDPNDYFEMPGGAFDGGDPWFRSTLVEQGWFGASPSTPTNPIAARSPDGSGPAVSSTTPSATTQPASTAPATTQPPLPTRRMNRPAVPILRRVSDVSALDAGSFAPSGSAELPWPGPTRAAGMALRLRPGDLVTSPTVCIRPTEPSVRFFYRGPAIPGSSLRVTVHQTIKDRSGGITSSVVRRSVVDIPATVGDSSWQLSPVLLTGSDLRSAPTDLLVSFAVVSSDPAVSDPGEWLVDNVLVDPFRAR